MTTSPTIPELLARHARRQKSRGSAKSTNSQHSSSQDSLSFKSLRSNSIMVTGPVESVEKQEIPKCHYHPAAKMRLVAADIPIFRSHSTGMLARYDNTRRKIYRCSVAGCPVVHNGPSEKIHMAREFSMAHINPWMDVLRWLCATN